MVEICKSLPSDAGHGIVFRAFFTYLLEIKLTFQKISNQIDSARIIRKNVIQLYVLCHNGIKAFDRLSMANISFETTVFLHAAHSCSP